MVCYRETIPIVDHTPSIFLKAAFNKFYWVHSWILCPICKCVAMKIKRKLANLYAFNKFGEKSVSHNNFRDIFQGIFRGNWKYLVNKQCATITFTWKLMLNSSRPDLGRREKINLNFYFHRYLWCLKRFCEGLEGLLETFRGTTDKCENKNLSELLF